MTDRAEIERLLNMTGRTLEGLPEHYSQAERENAHKRIRTGDYVSDHILHQSDVIELLIGALRDAVDKQPKWISVDERLPEHRQRVYARAKDGFCFESVYIVPVGFEKYEIGEGWINENKSVTHWVPLPEPPKEDV